jgi:hypothetical protein
MDRLWLAIAVVVLAVAAAMSPSPSVLTLFGHEVPTLCLFRLLTDVPCPGCGLTRSFVFLAHGMPIEAFRMNVLGPPLFVALAAQIPFRTWRIVRSSRAAS